MLVEGDVSMDPELPSAFPENMQKIYGNLRFVLVMERNSPESSQYSLCDYMVAYRQCKGLYLLKRKVTEKPDQMLLVVDESCDSTLQLNTSTFECKLQNEGQMCKRCEAYKEGPRHQRKMQLDQFYCFDQSLLREQIQRLCKTFVLNQNRVCKNAGDAVQFALYQEGERVKMQPHGSYEERVISSAARNVFNAVYFTPTGVVIDVGLGQICNFIGVLGESQKPVTLHSCYNQNPNSNLQIVIVADAKQRACMGLVNTGSVFV